MKKFKFDAHLHLKMPNGHNFMHIHNTPHTNHSLIRGHYYKSPHHFKTAARIVSINKVVSTIMKAGHKVKNHMGKVPQHGLLNPKTYKYKLGAL